MSKIEFRDAVILALAIVSAVLIIQVLVLWQEVGSQNQWLIGLRADVQALKTVQVFTKEMTDQKRILESLEKYIKQSEGVLEEDVNSGEDQP